MSENPYADINNESENPYADINNESEATKSEQVAKALGIMPVKGTMSMKPHDNPMDAAITMGSGIAGLVASGYAGIAGTVAGMVPGGESPNDKGTRWAKATREAITVAPNQAGEDVLGGLEKVGKAATALPSAALTMPLLDENMQSAQEFNREAETAGLEKFHEAQEIGPSKYAGEAVLDATGSPGFATFIETAPAAIAGAFGLRKPPKAPDAPPAPTTISGSGRASVGQPHVDTPVDFTPISSEKIVADLKAGKTKEVADAIYPDLEVVESARRLNVELNPEHYSTNTGFQDVARALKNRPGSKLQAAEVTALAKLNDEADSLVIEIGGSLDRGVFSDDIYTRTTGKIDKLDKSSKRLYKDVSDAIGNQVRVDPKQIVAFLKQRLDDLGGDVNALNIVEKKLLSLIRKDPETGEILSPTYLALDRTRKDIGDGYKGRGPFRKAGDAALGEGYALLSEIQQGVAEAFGVGEIYTQAKRAVQSRKTLEKSAVTMFNKEMTGTLVQKIRGSANALVGGDVSRFKQLMELLPETRRAEAAANVLGEILSGGSLKGAPVGQGFASSWRSLNKHQTAKNLLFSYLPKEARQSFDDIGRVVTAIIESTRKPLSNPSGSSGPIMKALDDLSLVEKLYDAGKTVAKAEGVSTAVGMPGFGTASAVGGLIARQRTPVSVAADELLTSPQFSQAMREAIDGDIAKADKMIAGSSAFKKWAATIDEQDAANIAKVGFIAWMIEDNQ